MQGVFGVFQHDILRKTFEKIKYTQKANSIQRDKCVVFLQQRHIVLPGQTYTLFWNYNTSTPEDSLVFPQFSVLTSYFQEITKCFRLYRPRPYGKFISAIFHEQRFPSLLSL